MIVHAETRDDATMRIMIALDDYMILGIKTNIPFLKRIMASKQFMKGDVHTHFIDRNVDSLKPRHDSLNVALVAAALHAAGSKRVSVRTEHASIERTTPWQEVGRWEICGLG